MFGSVLNGEMVLNSYGAISGELYLEIPGHFPNTELDEFIIMPNHIHAVLSIIDLGIFLESTMQPKIEISTLLGTIMGSYKSAVSKRINSVRNTREASVWHRSYYDRIISHANELAGIREYIISNPANWQQDDYYAGG